MFSDRIFQITLIVSFLVHGALLMQNSSLHLFSEQQKDKEVVVKYIKTPPKEKAKEKAKEARPEPQKREPFLKIPPKITLQKQTPPPFVDEESLAKINKTAPTTRPFFDKPAFIKPDVIAIKKKITLPAMDMNKINNPVYISYYQIVREKIKRAAYSNYTSTEVGEVTVSFVVSDNGYLKDMRMVEEKSSASPYLREIAIRSIKDASPFPAFPRELDYLQLSFNLAITFEIE